MSSLIDTLVEMGFAREKAEKALGNTGGNSLEDAINWIISHPDDDGGQKEEQSTVEITVDDQQGEKVPDTQPKEAKSFKCDECSKQFRNEDEVQFHAVKSGHSKFSESSDEVKPLSEEEKRARMLALQERLKEKRQQKEEEEKKSSIELEKQRRMTGQQMLAAKQRLEEQEMKKIAEDRKRQKKEDALAKQKILEQIKQDREAKKLQQSGASETSSPSAAAAGAASPAAVAAPPEAAAPPKQSYDQCQLQIRLLTGGVLKQSFGAKEPLSAVRLFVQLNGGDATEPFTFMTNFPKRVFTDVDMEAPLAELGLVPSAVLIMTRKV